MLQTIEVGTANAEGWFDLVPADATYLGLTLLQGVGRMLKLTEMGEIKKQLAAEAEADRIKDQELQPGSGGQRSEFDLMRRIGQWLVPSAVAGERIVLAQAARTDETLITLKPAEGVEYKIELPKGGQVQYRWTVNGGVVNYDMHGTPKGGGKESSYKAARGVGGDDGTLTAGFDGTHGWFFRNRGSQPVTITLQTSGSYAEIRKVI